MEVQFESSLKLQWKTQKVRDIFPSGVLQPKPLCLQLKQIPQMEEWSYSVQQM